MAAPPKFDVLWKAYSKTKIGGACLKRKHQCAIRMSACLAKAGLKITKHYRYMHNTCKVNGVVHAWAAEELANYLIWNLKKPAWSYPFSARDDVKGKKGIILFKDIKGFAVNRGDHIDLWDGSKTKTGEYFDRCKLVEFWELK